MEAKDPKAVRFREAVARSDVSELRALVEGDPRLAAHIDAPWFSFDKPALVEAASRLDRPLVDTLLELGADIDARSAWANGPYSALHGLVDGPTPEKLDFAEYLVRRGATIDLHAAAGLGRIDVLTEILDGEPDRVSEPGPDGATPLHLARDAETAAFLLDRGAEIEKRCVDHRSTPIMWAADGREDVVRLLLARGARPDLYIAALVDDVELAERILAEDPDGIHVSVSFGHSHDHLGGGDKYVWALGGAETPVELARRRGTKSVHALLLERSPDDVRLLQAARSGDPGEMERLLDADDQLLPGLTEHRVCQILCSTPEGARALLARGVSPDARDAPSGATALHHAAWRGLRGVVDVLLAAGADPRLRDREHDATPAEWARHAGRDDLARRLSV